MQCDKNDFTAVWAMLLITAYEVHGQQEVSGGACIRLLLPWYFCLTCKGRGKTSSTHTEC
jgi:hypothetical protein